MDIINTLIQRNEVFSKTDFNADLKIMPPTKKLMIIACVDPRVDPSDVFGLKPGEAAVIRNVGGRINTPTLQTLGLVRTVGKNIGVQVGPGWNLIILHHTDCGITPCLHHAPELLAKNLGVSVEDLDSLAISDPYEAIAIDIAALKENPQLPAGMMVTGFVYDVATGLVKTVVPTGLLRPENPA
ncbi:carbonic anhydrase [Pseudomonas sp. NA-150]|uniref:carbonic anhydrase n=1 Tax=Pseudomonas sp. NA-150 TaxID=3367525 RepID=UPI0037CAF8E5